MRYISDFSEGRDNNLNLLRMIAAWCVLVSHAWPLSYGAGTIEPLHRQVGLSIGGCAVIAFFTISGFLITRSYERSSSIVEWFCARVLRIIPGLFVVLLMTVVLLGPIVTSLDVGGYFGASATASYIPRNLLLVSLQYPLPGVFEENPYPDAINGSLWTLKYEVLCYAGVLLLGVLGILKRAHATAISLGVFVICYVLVVLFRDHPAMNPQLVSLVHLGLPFAIGLAFYVWRNVIPLNLWVGAVLATAAVMATGTVFGRDLFVVALCYGVFLLAYIPGGLIRKYNKVGDFSYGIYIYAFPVQQLMVYWFSPLTPFENVALAMPVTLLLAIFSWRFVEKPALGRRHAIARWLDRRFKSAPATETSARVARE